VDMKEAQQSRLFRRLGSWIRQHELVHLCRPSRLRSSSLQSSNMHVAADRIRLSHVESAFSASTGCYEHAQIRVSARC